MIKSHYMKIAIVGAGAAGLVAAIKIKSANPEFEVFLFDRLDSVAKKIKATGNGKCNIGNIDKAYDGYSHPAFVKAILDEYAQQEVLSSLGLPTKLLTSEGLYPVSESANNVAVILEKNAIGCGVKIVLNTCLLDYYLVEDQIELHFDKYDVTFDRVLFCVGGKSNPNLGSDGSLFDVFKKHGYIIVEPKPGLCPIKVKEDVRGLFGQRLHAVVNLFLDGKLAKEEYGEVMFKKDGLSGIVIMNISSLIARSRAREAKIYLSILDGDQHIITVKDIFEMSKKAANPLLAYATSEVAAYIYRLANVDAAKSLSYEDCQKIAKVAASIPFTFAELYDYEFSQVTVGGVGLDDINDDLSSKREKNVYFLGEVLDIDGPCGGYNLRWAIGSALRASKSIHENTAE